MTNHETDQPGTPDSLREDTPTTIAESCERLLALELEQEFFDVRVSGVPIWERLRFHVNRTLLQETGITGEAHSSERIDAVSALQKTARNFLWRNPLFADEADFLLWGHERRKLSDDGQWRDVYCDPLLDRLDDDVAYLEAPHEERHLTPAKTDDVRYLDYIRYLSLAAEKVVDPTSLLSADERDALSSIEADLRAAFGTAPDVVEMAATHLLHRRVKRPLYDAILRRVDPDVAVVVVSYGRETFIEACRDRGVPTVELQHGTLSRYHLGYSYPGPRTKQAFPDYFLSFGPFWSEVAEFPIADDRIIPVGYPHLESGVARHADASTDADVVFLSQGTIGAELSQFAASYAAANPETNVAYKLHPGEYARWREAYPWLADAPLTVHEDCPLYELLAGADVQVGVYSTALYEGLRFDLETYVVDLPGAAYMTRLIEQGGAELVDDPADITASGETSTTDGVDVEQMFTPNAAENAVEALTRIQSAACRTDTLGNAKN